MASGRLFQARGPATAKARSPSVDLHVAGTIRSDDVNDRRRRRDSMLASEQTVCWCLAYPADPCRQRYTSTQSLYCIRSAIRTQ